ncbi:MAG: DUF3078 domain-containing protein [Bacteroidota bacterium]|nr:DUF3078 domain-containing protein [Bacteroidota bacterium]
MNSVFAEEVNDTTATTDTVKAWTRGSEGNISFSQIAFSDWAAGGKNSLATSGIFNFYLNYAKNNQAWDNNLNFGYGIMRLDGNDYKKSDDKIQIETKYGLRASKKWFYSAAISFKTQFNDGFKYKDDTKTKVSDFFAPAYLTYSLGMDYKPHKNLSILLSPATGKTTFVYNDSLSNAGAYGVDVGKNIKTEVGSYIKMQFKTDILKNIELKSNLDLFSSFTNNPKNIDINWEAYITMKVNKYISTNIQTHLIYDDDINIEYKEGKSGPHLQFKELFGVGFTYKI